MSEAIFKVMATVRVSKESQGERSECDSHVASSPSSIVSSQPGVATGRESTTGQAKRLEPLQSALARHTCAHGDQSGESSCFPATDGQHEHQQLRHEMKNQQSSISRVEADIILNIPQENASANQMVSLRGNQMVSSPRNQMVSSPGNEMVSSLGNQMVSTLDNEMVSTQGNQMVSTQGNQMVSTQGNQMVNTQGNQMVSTPDNKMVSTQGNQMVSAQGNQMVSSPGNQMVSSPDNQMVSSPGNQMVSSPGNQMVSSPGNQMVSSPGNQMVSSPGNQMVSTPDHQMVSSSRNQMVSPRGNQVVGTAGSQMVSLPNNQIVDSPGNRINSSRGSQMVSTQDNQRQSDGYGFFHADECKLSLSKDGMPDSDATASHASETVVDSYENYGRGGNQVVVDSTISSSCQYGGASLGSSVKTTDACLSTDSFQTISRSTQIASCTTAEQDLHGRQCGQEADSLRSRTITSSISVLEDKDTNVPLCACEEESAVCICDECKEFFCEDCFQDRHHRGKLKSHKRHFLPNMRPPVQPCKDFSQQTKVDASDYGGKMPVVTTDKSVVRSIETNAIHPGELEVNRKSPLPGERSQTEHPMCGTCEATPSTVYCKECDQTFCKGCDMLVHKVALLKSHFRSPIAESLALLWSASPVGADEHSFPEVLAGWSPGSSRLFPLLRVTDQSVIHSSAAQSQEKVLLLEDDVSELLKSHGFQPVSRKSNTPSYINFSKLVHCHITTVGLYGNVERISCWLKENHLLDEERAEDLKQQSPGIHCLTCSASDVKISSSCIQFLFLKPTEDFQQFNMLSPTCNLFRCLVELSTCVFVFYGSDEVKMFSPSDTAAEKATHERKLDFQVEVSEKQKMDVAFNKGFTEDLPLHSKVESVQLVPASGRGTIVISETIESFKSVSQQRVCLSASELQEFWKKAESSFQITFGSNVCSEDIWTTVDIACPENWLVRKISQEKEMWMQNAKGKSDVVYIYIERAVECLISNHCDVSKYFLPELMLPDEVRPEGLSCSGAACSMPPKHLLHEPKCLPACGHNICLSCLVNLVERCADEQAGHPSTMVKCPQCCIISEANLSHVKDADSVTKSLIQQIVDDKCLTKAVEKRWRSISVAEKVISNLLGSVSHTKQLLENMAFRKLKAMGDMFVLYSIAHEEEYKCLEQTMNAQSLGGHSLMAPSASDDIASTNSIIARGKNYILQAGDVGPEVVNEYFKKKTGYLSTMTAALAKKAPRILSGSSSTISGEKVREETKKMSRSRKASALHSLFGDSECHRLASQLKDTLIEDLAELVDSIPPSESEQSFSDADFNTVQTAIRKAAAEEFKYSILPGKELAMEIQHVSIQSKLQESAEETQITVEYHQETQVSNMPIHSVSTLEVNSNISGNQSGGSVVSPMVAVHTIDELCFLIDTPHDHQLLKLYHLQDGKALLFLWNRQEEIMKIDLIEPEKRVAVQRKPTKARKTLYQSEQSWNHSPTKHYDFNENDNTAALLVNDHLVVLKFGVRSWKADVIHQCDLSKYADRLEDNLQQLMIAPHQQKVVALMKNGQCFDIKTGRSKKVRIRSVKHSVDKALISSDGEMLFLLTAEDAEDMRNVVDLANAGSQSTGTGIQGSTCVNSDGLVPTAEKSSSPQQQTRCNGEVQKLRRMSERIAVNMYSVKDFQCIKENVILDENLFPNEVLPSIELINFGFLEHLVGMKHSSTSLSLMSYQLGMQLAADEVKLCHIPSTPGRPYSDEQREKASDNRPCENYLKYLQLIYDKFAVQDCLKTCCRDVHLICVLDLTDDEVRRMTPQCKQYVQSLLQNLHQETSKPLEGFTCHTVTTTFKASKQCVSRHVHFLTPCKANKWVQDLICQVPIQIAKAENGKFMLLSTSQERDGALQSKQAEDVQNCIHFGLYEAIFDWWRGPVKVVSSMGKQSTGKSFLLNHLTGSMFDISGGRCTCGVWFTARITDDCLYVVLDFEGLGSEDRTENEDVFLSVFQAGISGMTLLKTDYAMDRELKSLLSGFQEGANLITEGREWIMRGVLYVNVRDVHRRDISTLQEHYKQKIRELCKRGKGLKDNFLSSLFHGKLVVHPFPPLQSQEFFHNLKKIWDHLCGDNTPSFPNSRTFRNVCTLLMAKVCCLEWGQFSRRSLVETIRSLRACLDQLVWKGDFTYVEDPTLLLVPVDDLEITLDDGTVITGLPDEGTVLKQSDLSKDSGSVIADLDKPIFTAFCKIKGSQYSTESPSEKWYEQLREFYKKVCERRQKRVLKWLTQLVTENADDPDIKQLKRDAQSSTSSLFNIWTVCRDKCSSCYYPCVRLNDHHGEHSCRGSHTCEHFCSYCRTISSEDIQEGDQTSAEDDGSTASDNIPKCKLPAAHDGKHDCKEGKHTCGKACYFKGTRNCSGTCTKVVRHGSDTAGNDFHQCDAPNHLCQERCEAPKCLRFCEFKLTEHGNGQFSFKPHQHDCGESDCLSDCKSERGQCRRRCVKGHFHALDVVHICDQEHHCLEDCEQPGNCDVVNASESTTATFKPFKGKEFEYTKLPERVAKRGQCDVMIQPNQASHDGEHKCIHAVDDHTCTERCPGCGYYCMLPIDHDGDHEPPGHGNMWHATLVCEDNSFKVGEHHYHKYQTGNPHMCNLVCKQMGRGHIHFLPCTATKAEDCQKDQPNRGHRHHHGQSHDVCLLDEYTHRAFWEEMEFVDPCGEQGLQLSKCGAKCPAESHTEDKEIFCELPKWHKDCKPGDFKSGFNYQGHHFNCGPHPKLEPIHHILVVDKSSSMMWQDAEKSTCHPDFEKKYGKGARLGAVLDACYRYLTARSTHGVVDIVSFISFNTKASVLFKQEELHPSNLLKKMATLEASGNTNFTEPLKLAGRVIEETENERPEHEKCIVLFLSDGNAELKKDVLHSLLESRKSRGKSMLRFHTVKFGNPWWTFNSGLELENMAKIVREFADGDAFASQSSYHFSPDSLALLDVVDKVVEDLNSQGGYQMGT